jgi:hypothetical protein
MRKRCELTPAEVSEIGYDRVELDVELLKEVRKAEERSCYWCSACKDMLPDNDVCEHMDWCDDCGVMNTPDDDECSHRRDEESDGW